MCYEAVVIEPAIGINIETCPKMNGLCPFICSQLIFIKRVKIYMEEKTVCSINGAGKIGYPHAQEWNETPASHIQKINYK
jgi:hypothetical protein